MKSHNKINLLANTDFFCFLNLLRKKSIAKDIIARAKLSEFGYINLCKKETKGVNGTTFLPPVKIEVKPSKILVANQPKKPKVCK